MRNHHDSNKQLNFCIGNKLKVQYYLQRMMGLSALEAGLWTLPQAIASALFMPIGGRLYDKIGPRPLVIGLSIVAGGAFLLSHITPQDDAMAFLIPRALLGMGMGMALIGVVLGSTLRKVKLSDKTTHSIEII